MITRHLGFSLNVLALALFVPGILLPMFALNMELAALLGNSSLTSDLVDKELSILATVSDLWHDDRMIVAALIFAFSVCVPALKTTLVTAAYVRPDTVFEGCLLRFVGTIGKWSMADVFVVAIFLAILSTNHAETNDVHQFSILGFSMSLEISTQTLSAVGQGFYFFTGYCLMSMAGTQLALYSWKKRQSIAYSSPKSIRIKVPG
jgi:hypothetical protein